jgi:hypothetical protein
MWTDQSRPELPFFNEKTEGLLDSQLYQSRSRDEGATWSAPEWIDPRPFDVPLAYTGPILRFPDGELGLQFELNKHYEDPRPWRHSSVFLFSTDGGRTWPRASVASNDPANRMYWWDQRPSVLPDGRLLDVFWSFDKQTASYINIQARESRDRGRTWSAMWDTGAPGQPAPVMPLKDGRLAMVYVDRTSSVAIRARVSADGGKTWPAETQVTIYGDEGQRPTWDKKSMQDAWAEMYKFAVGLPTTASLADGDVLVVYYAGPETDKTDIKWARVRF